MITTGALAKSRKTAVAFIAGWLIFGLLFVLYTARAQRAVIETALRQESAILHRLISQRADQHDAHLTSLSALAQAGDPPPAALFLQVAAAIQRFYPRVRAVDLVPLSPDAVPITTRHSGMPSPASLAAISDAARRSSGERVLLISPQTPNHYLIVKRSPNSEQARFGLALAIDARALIDTAAPFWQSPGASVALAMPDGTVVARHQPELTPAGSGYWAALTIRKTLGSGTQPLLLTTQRVPQLGELFPADRLVLGLATLAGVLIITALVMRLGSRIRSAERRARLSEQDARLAHASRVNALGEMASGMAHELTQPLTAILSQSQAGLRLVTSGSVEQDAIGEILAANVAQSKRAAAIVTRLRQWTTRTDRVMSDQNLNDCIGNVAFLLGHDARRLRIELAVRADPIGPIVLGDAVAIEQVIFNLVRNAIEALEQTAKPGGRVAMSSAVRGGEAVLEVIDNGPGIAPAMRERLFEPFATGKSDGMGLGLTLCERIVERMGGRITLGEGPAAGVTARVTLPLAGTKASQWPP